MARMGTGEDDDADITVIVEALPHQRKRSADPPSDDNIDKERDLTYGRRGSFPLITMPLKTVEKATGALFGKLFPAYDDTLFLSSMELLAKRFSENKFPLKWFKGKKCLDVGCGGGRYSLALAGLGAKEVQGIDVSKAAVADARKRAKAMGVKNVKFQVGSALDLPFADASFDCVIFSGVLMITEEPVKALAEMARVTKPGGMLYLLVYATEGIRWPLVEMLRPLAMTVGFEAMDRAVADAGLAANRRRTYLDDLLVPYIDFYSWECLKDMLKDKGFSKVDRWKKGRLDHEENLTAYLKDMEGFFQIMDAAASSRNKDIKKYKEAFAEGRDLCKSVVDYVRNMKKLVDAGKLKEKDAMTMLVGQGHHRVVAWRDK